jgi:hypothetical protein
MSSVCSCPYPRFHQGTPDQIMNCHLRMRISLQIHTIHGLSHSPSWTNTHHLLSTILDCGSDGDGCTATMAQANSYVSHGRQAHSVLSLFLRCNIVGWVDNPKKKQDSLLVDRCKRAGRRVITASASTLGHKRHVIAVDREERRKLAGPSVGYIIRLTKMTTRPVRHLSKQSGISGVQSARCARQGSAGVMSRLSSRT